MVRLMITNMDTYEVELFGTLDDSIYKLIMSSYIIFASIIVGEETDLPKGISSSSSENYGSIG